MPEQAPPEQSSEPAFESISNALNQEMMRLFMGMPAVLESIFEAEGPTDTGGADIPAEQFAEVVPKIFWMLLKYTQRIAVEVDVLRGKVAVLEKQTRGSDKDSH